MKETLLLLCCILLISCDDQRIDDNIRLNLKGNVVNESLNPIAAATVEAYTDFSAREFDFTTTKRSEPNPNTLLARGTTDSIGLFDLISLYDNDDNYTVLIDADPGYSRFMLDADISNILADDLTLDLGMVQLLPKKTITIAFDNQSNTKDNLVYTATYVEAFCNAAVDESLNQVSFENCYSERQINGSVNSEAISPEIQFETIDDSSITIEYIIGDNGIVMTETFNSQNNTYVVSY
jgi:hypothetical protein